MPNDRMIITQIEMRKVLAGQTLYVEFVHTTRNHLMAGGLIQNGPLTIDMKALQSRGVPLKIIVPSPGWLSVPRTAFGPVPGDNGPSSPPNDVKSFVSLLDPTADWERRRKLVKQYDLLVAGYRMSADVALVLRRNYLSSGVVAKRAGTFMRGALVLNGRILFLRAMGLFYRLGITAPSVGVGTQQQRSYS